MKQKNLKFILLSLASIFSLSCSSDFFKKEGSIFTMSKIIVESKEDEGKINIFSIDIKTKKRVNLTSSLDADNFSFDISKDKKKIVFASKLNEKSNIYIMDIDGSNLKQLTNDQDLNLFPKISPDGKKIAYISNIDGNDEICVINTDGTDKKRLTSNYVKDSNISWFPDSKKITFYSYRDFNNEIYVMNSDGTEPINITKNSANDYYPVVSPDGKNIIFVSNRNSKWNIFISSINGDNVKKLSDGFLDIIPSWSNKGNKLSFITKEKEESDLNSIVIKDIFLDKKVTISKNEFSNYPNISNSDDFVVFTLTEANKNKLIVKSINSGSILFSEESKYENSYPILI